MQANVALIDTLNKEIAKLEKHLAQCLRPRPEHALLGTAPALGASWGPSSCWKPTTGPLRRR